MRENYSKGSWTASLSYGKTVVSRKPKGKPVNSLHLCHKNESCVFSLLHFLSFECSSFLFWPNSELLPSFIQIAVS